MFKKIISAKVRNLLVAVKFLALISPTQTLPGREGFKNGI
jgi:hypothetical protein